MEIVSQYSFDRKIDYLERTIKYLENPHNEFNPERYYKGSLTLKPIAAELKLFLAKYKELKTLYSFYEDQNNNGSTTENT